MTKETACALDCYDACRIVVGENGLLEIAGDREHPAGNGALCSLVNKSIHEEPRIEKPRVDGVEVSMAEAMDAVKVALEKPKSLLWRGSGNMGVMQEVTNLLMEKISGTLTHGSLCDGAGDAGIVEGRGVNRILPLEQIAKADTVVVWGRNLSVTNAHMMPYVEGKKIVVIDPIKTPIAKKADLHLQLNPRTDYYLAIMLARFVYMEDSQESEWLEEFAPEHEEFYEFTQEHRIKPLLEYIGTDLGEMGEILNFLRNKKVVFLVGVGVQKYSTGASTLHAIDSLAALLGLFGRGGSGVHYLGNSKLGFENPFEVRCQTVPKAVCRFSEFDTVLVQGGNPAASMPDSTRVCAELESVENLIYFGLYENETSQRAKIVIPAKNFFEKEDLRLSYGHHYVQMMNQIIQTPIGISEYEFTRVLFGAFGLEGLEREDAYISHWIDGCKMENGRLISPAYQTIPYADGFGKDGGGEYLFVDDYDDDFVNTKRFAKARTSKRNSEEDGLFWLLSSKSAKALNTQFRRANSIHIHPSVGYKEGEKVRLTSSVGCVELQIHLDDTVRQNCLLVPNNTLGINQLTPAILSNEGDNACYQEIRVEVERVELD